ncbi:LysR family transcriptional regulator, partial [Roseomonas sp. JC162]|nr:LysR family transcriptional regulator [Neoroseomonas marina]
MRDADSKAIVAMLRGGDVDMGILSRNTALDGYLFTPLFEDEFLVVVPREGHPLSARR